VQILHQTIETLQHVLVQTQTKDTLHKSILY